VQAAVAKVLFRFSSKHGTLPRLLKKPFENLEDAPAVLKAFPTWKDQDHNSAFKSVGICCSTSLVSQDPEATPTQVFLSGYSASSVSIKVLEKLLSDCGAGLKNKMEVPKLAKAIMALAKEHGLPQATGLGSMGHLLQIFIRRSLVDKWTYASHPMGVPDATRESFAEHLASEGPILGQARMVVNPSAFMRASSVRLYTVSADETFHNARPAFQDGLEKLLAPILGRPEVRERAAQGIYGGKLPAWWRDLSEEKASAEKAEKKTDAASAEIGGLSGEAKVAVVCLLPGCGKPTWNGQPGEFCGNKCKREVKAQPVDAPMPQAIGHVHDGKEANSSDGRDLACVAPRKSKKKRKGGDGALAGA